MTHKRKVRNRGLLIGAGGIAMLVLGVAFANSTGYGVNLFTALGVVLLLVAVVLLVAAVVIRP